jgi:hypothetical protein
MSTAEEECFLSTGYGAGDNGVGGGSADLGDLLSRENKRRKPLNWDCLVEMGGGGMGLEEGEGVFSVSFSLSLSLVSEVLEPKREPESTLRRLVRVFGGRGSPTLGSPEFMGGSFRDEGSSSCGVGMVVTVTEEARSVGESSSVMMRGGDGGRGSGT